MLVTGAGGPAGIAALRSLTALDGLEVHAADADRWAAGLHLLPPERRHLLPGGREPGYAARLRAVCVAAGIDVVLPTVDRELLAIDTARPELERLGVRVALPTGTTVALCANRALLAARLGGEVPVPRTDLLGGRVDPSSWRYPVVVRPVDASARGTEVITSAAELAARPADPRRVVQAHLPGDPVDLDVVADGDGRVVAVVPRHVAPDRHGRPLAAWTAPDPALDALGREVAGALGLTHAATIRLRRDADGVPHVVDVRTRVTSGAALSAAAGVDLPRWAVAVALGEPLPAVLPARAAAVTRLVELVEVRDPTLAGAHAGVSG